MRATFAWSASETSVLWASLRLVLVSFDVRIWRIFDWPRTILPVPVFLKRLAAPRCVLSLGMVFLLESACLQQLPVYGKPRVLATRGPTGSAQAAILPRPSVLLGIGRIYQSLMETRLV